MMEKIYHNAIAFLMMTLIAVVCYADDTLVGYWNFDEGNGIDVEDMSDAGNDGVVKGDVQWKQGKVVTAISLTKQGKGYVEVADSESLDISEQITISAWIKPGDIYIGGDWKERNCIAAKLRAYYLDIAETGNLAFYLYNVQPQEWLIGETDLTDLLNTWIHVAAVYDGSEQKLYINGELDISAKKSGTITMNNDYLAIGWVDNNRYFDGLIDEVKIWSRALSEDELKGLLPVDPMGCITTCWGDLKR
jgi:hypothetical protein